MIKTAAIFPDQCARNSRPVLAAAVSALQQAGVKIMENSWNSDAAIIWSVLWSGRMAANRAIYQHYRNEQRPVIVIDVGTLIRGVTWKIALDNINRDGWYGDHQDLDLDRPSRLGLIRARPPQGHRVLIATQHRSSLQAQSIPSMEQWVVDKIEQTRAVTDRAIVIRPHPRDLLRMTDSWPGVTLERPRSLPGTYDSFDWQDAWHAVINHNSGPGVLAAIAGVRPVVDSSSLAWPVSVSMPDIERSYDLDREAWLIDIAHTEYFIEEISQGAWLKRLGSRL